MRGSDRVKTALKVLGSVSREPIDPRKADVTRCQTCRTRRTALADGPHSCSSGYFFSAITALSRFASVPPLLPTRSCGPTCLSVYPYAALLMLTTSLRHVMISSLSGLPFTITRMPLSTLSTMKLTFGLTFSERPPSNSQSTPALRQASRQAPTAPGTRPLPG
jgi:hypothetical protein